MYVYIWISFFHTSFPNFTFTLRMCLVEWILGRMEKNEKKKKENFLEGVRLGGREEKNGWGLGVFSPSPPQSFLSKIGRKLWRQSLICLLTKMPMCTYTWAFVQYYLFVCLFVCFYLFFFSSNFKYLPFVLIFFSFAFLKLDVAFSSLSFFLSFFLFFFFCFFVFFVFFVFLFFFFCVCV